MYSYSEIKQISTDILAIHYCLENHFIELKEHLACTGYITMAVHKSLTQYGLGVITAPIVSADHPHGDSNTSFTYHETGCYFTGSDYNRTEFQLYGLIDLTTSGKNEYIHCTAPMQEEEYFQQSLVLQEQKLYVMFLMNEVNAVVRSKIKFRLDKVLKFLDDMERDTPEVLTFIRDTYNSRDTNE